MCELLVGGEGPDCFRLNLERGCFMAPLETGASGLNVVSVAPAHGMLVLGTSDGRVQCWDPRQRCRLGEAHLLGADCPVVLSSSSSAHAGGPQRVLYAGASTEHRRLQVKQQRKRTRIREVLRRLTWGQS